MDRGSLQGRSLSIAPQISGLPKPPPGSQGVEPMYCIRFVPFLPGGWVRQLRSRPIMATVRSHSFLRDQNHLMNVPAGMDIPGR